jgi:protein involved in sex pheromone biosynthesis
MMLSLYTEGYGYSKRLCEDVVTWFIAKYLPRHKLEIEVLHRGLKREQALGYCDVAGETYKPRNFLIELDTYLDKKTYATVLLHELIHLQQWVNEELKLKSSKRYFKGECVEDLEYLEQPHEIQAHYYERILYYQYLKDRGLTNF